MNRPINWVISVALCVILAAMIAAAFVRTRHAAHVMLCANSLQQIAIAVQNYHTDFFKFPPAVVAHDSLPIEDRLSWQAYLWPYTTSTGLRIDYTKAWRDPANVNLRMRGMGSEDLGPVGQLDIFSCRSNPCRMDPPQIGMTHYVGITGLGVDSARLAKDHPRAGVFAYEDRNVSLNYIEERDGKSNTLLAAETCHENGPWMAGGRPTARGLEQGSPLPYLGRGGQFSALHYSGGRIVTNVVFADCSTRSFAASMDPKVFEALATMAGGETVPSLED